MSSPSAEVKPASGGRSADSGSSANSEEYEIVAEKVGEVEVGEPVQSQDPRLLGRGPQLVQEAPHDGEPVGADRRAQG